MVEDVVFEQLTVNDVATKPIEAVLEHGGVLFGQDFDTLLGDIVADGSLGCRKWLPVLSDVNQVALIYLDDKVIREVLVGDLSHLGLLAFEETRSEAQQDKYHLGLCRESHGSVMGIWVRCELIVDVVVLQGVDEALDQQPIHPKPAEEVHWISWWNHSLLRIRRAELGPTAPAHLGHSRRQLGVRSALVPNIANHHALPSNRWDEPVHQEKHDAVVVVDLDEEALAFLLRHDALHRVVYEVILSDPVHKLLDLEVVLMDGLEEDVEAFEDVQVRLLELLVDVDEINVGLYLLIALVLEVTISQVLHIEEDLLVLPLLVLLQAQRVFSQLCLQLLLCLFALGCLLALSILLIFLAGLLLLRRRLGLLNLLLNRPQEIIGLPGFKQEHIWNMVGES